MFPVMLPALPAIFPATFAPDTPTIAESCTDPTATEDAITLAPKLPAVAQAIQEKKQQLIELSGKPGTTHEEFSRGLKDLLDFDPDSLGDGAKQWKR